MEQEDFHKSIQILSPLLLPKEVIEHAGKYFSILDSQGY
jgi:hypothetical protein